MNKSKVISLIGMIREKANRLIIRELESYGIYDLAPSHGGIIVSLCLLGEMTMKELAREIDRDKSTVTALVAKLIKLGYVQKKTDEHDSRVKKISLTGKGKSLEGPFREISEKLLAKTFSNLNENEQQTVADLLKRINDGWE